MSGTSLFDILASKPSGRKEGSAGLPWLAHEMLTASLADLERLQLYEERFASGWAGDLSSKLEVLRSIFQLYAEWADEAESVLARVRGLDSKHVRFDDVTRLDHAIGTVRARLTVSPDRIVKSKEQARQRQFVPAKELRDELHARLRP
jgi:hypothetical protein